MAIFNDVARIRAAAEKQAESQQLIAESLHNIDFNLSVLMGKLLDDGMTPEETDEVTRHIRAQVNKLRNIADAPESPTP